MRPEETFVGQPVRSLQQMLRTIAESRDDQVSVVPDGIYGPDTVKAVSNFQRRKGMTVNGITDQQTWESIVQEYEIAVIAVTEPEPLRITLPQNQAITAGQRDPALYIVQAVLQVMSETYKTITPPAMSGVLDLATGESLRCFQELSGLPVTGELDRLTWHHLAMQYPLSARVGAGSPNDRGQIRK